MARRKTETRCIVDKPIDGLSWRSHCDKFVPPIFCPICDAGPLHSKADCGCSYLRNNVRVCRDCAIGFDVLHYGKSRIHNQLAIIDPITQSYLQRGIKIHDI